MGHKHPGKITKKFVSVLAASAIVTTQIPSNLLAANANVDTGLPLSVGSLFDSDAINLSSVKSQDKSAEISSLTANSQTSSTTPPSTTSTISTTTSQAASNPTTTVTTSQAALVSEESTSKDSTPTNSGTIQPNPTLSLSKSVISASEAGKTVPVTIFINEDNFKDEEYYSNANVSIDFDGRLSLCSVQAGTGDNTNGLSASYSSYSYNSYRKTYNIYANHTGDTYGKNGALATLNVTIPADAQPGDIYYFNIFKTNNLKPYFNYSNPQIKSSYDSYAFTTADNSDDKYLKDTPFDGYILIDPKSQASSTATSSRQVVMKDLVYYNVYSDHAEVAYCDYEAENVEIASEINGKDVTKISDYAFYNTNVKTVSIPDTITNIASYAFYNSALESVEIPDSVKEIGYAAFQGTKITKVNYPSASTKCSSSIFQDCKNLTEVIFPDDLTSIPDYTFASCSALESVELPDSLESIGYEAFYYSGLKTISFPESLKSIGGYAFYNSKLEKVDYPAESVSCGSNIFGYCSELKEVTIPDGVKTIPDYAFYYCKALESIVLPDSLETINNYAFGYTGLKTVKFPESLKSIGNYAFQSSNLEKIDYPASSVACGSSIFSSCAKLKEITIADGTTSIPAYAFSDCESLEKINLPDSVESIGSYAFSNTSLKSITYPESLKSIGNNAFQATKLEKVEYPATSISCSTGIFQNCTSLKEVTFPEDLKSLPEYTFSGCTALESIELPDSVEYINNSSLANTGIKSIAYPESLKSIGSYAFLGSKLEKVNYPDTSISISTGVFQNCSSLTEVTFPDNIKYIPDYTFYGCTALESIDLPNSVEYIYNYAFANSGLKSIAYPESLKSIGSYAFQNTKFEKVEYPAASISCGAYIFNNCKSLTEVTFPEDLTNIPNYAFYNCEALEKVTLPDTVTSIGQYAFYQSGVKEINIPEKMTSLPSYSLAGTKIESIVIPDNITYIGDGVFLNCSKLTSVDLGSKITYINNKTFSGCTQLEELEIPSSVQYLYSNIFENSGLKEITIPDTVTSLSSATFTNSNIESIIYSDERTTLPSYAYGGASKLTDPKLPSKLTTLPGYVFTGCTSLKSFEIPSTITAINSYAFSGSSITSLNVPANVQNMGSYAFANSALESIEFSDEITAIPSDAFYYAQKLKSVKLPASLTSIPYYAFYYCTALEEIDIPDSVKSIENYSFYNCTALSTINLSESLETIGYDSFYNCRSLKKVILPDNVTSIGTECFRNCSNLSEIELPEKLVTISSSAFSGTAIKKIEMPASVKNLANAFSGSNIETIIYPDSLTTLPAHAFSSAAKMKSVELPSNLEALPENCFYNCTGLTDFTIPESIKTINANAFYGSGVKELKVPSTVETLKNYALAYSNLVKVELDDKFTTIPASLFYSSAKLSSVKLPSELTAIPSSTFYSCTALQSIDLPETITSIGSYAFAYSGLKSIELPDSVTAIDNYVFINANKLESVKFSKNLTSIPYQAFYYCTSLKELDIPDNITSIGNYAFQNCTSLKKASIGKGVKSITYSAFNNCTSLTELNLSEGLETIDRYVFSNCSSLEKVTLPSTVTSIGQYAFKLCAKLADIELSENLTSIGTEAFSGTAIKEISLPATIKSLSNTFAGSNIETIIYPDSLTVLPAHAYSGAAKMTSVTLPSDLEAIPENCFYGCSGLTEFTIPENVKTINKNAFQGSSIKQLTIPSTVETLADYALASSNLETVEIDEKFTELPSWLFYNSQKLSSVKLPSDLKVIPLAAFYNCYALQSIDLPDSLETIGGSAFQYAGLTSIDIPDTVKSIDSSAFYGANKLTSVKLPEGLTTVPYRAFYSCSALTDIDIPETVTSIGEQAFYNCLALKDIELPEGVKTISNYAFYNCSSLESIDLPSTVTSLGSYIFNSCSKLTTLELPENIETIGSYAFAGTGIKEVKIPATIKSVQNNAFSNSNVETITYDDSITALPAYAYSGASKMKEVTLPSKITYVPSYAFSGCSSLTSITIPETVKSIGDYAFQGDNALTKIELPGSVESIGNYAFYNCTSLNEFNMGDNVKSIGYNAFYSCSKLASITLSENLESIGSYAFSGTVIKELDMPATIKSVQNAFSNSNIEKLTYPDSMETLPAYAYAYTNKVTSIKLPSQLTAIPSYAFYSSAVQEIAIPDGVTKLDGYAFYGNNTIKSVELPDSVTSIGEYAFNNCAVTSVKLPSEIETLGTRCFSNSQLESVEVPESVKTIGDFAFSNMSKLKSVKLSSGLETIGNSAFYNCPLLSDIMLPDTVKSIGTYAFYNESALAELEIPASVESIGSSAFQGSGLKSVVIPETVNSLGTNSLFSNCSKLESAVINAPITNLESDCFNNCSSLKSVELPESVSSIGYYSFNNCTALKSIYIPANVQSINSSAFYNSGITTIVGHRGSAAEKYAADHSLEFLEAEVKTWNKSDSLPSVGTYKLGCDVTLDGDITVAQHNLLDIDLNGHKVTMGKFAVSGNMTVRDSSNNKTGCVYTSSEAELFNVSGSLNLVGGKFIGNELEKNAATVLMGYGGNFTLDGATVISHYGSALSFSSYNSNAILTSGTLDTASKNDKGDSSEYAAIYFDGSNYGNVTITNATVKAGKGCGIYKNTTGGPLTIKGGKITSEKNYGIYCNNGGVVYLSGKLDITGADAGLYIPGGKCINIVGELTGGNVKVESAKTGIITGRYSEFHNGTDPSEFFTAVNGAYLTLDSSSSEVVYNTVTTTTTTTTATTTTSAATSSSTTTASTTSADVTSTTNTTTTSASTTSSSATSSTTSTTTTTTTRAPFAPVTTEYDPQIEEEIKEEKNERLKITGELTATRMTKDEIISAGIDVDDPDNYHYFNYKVEMTFHDMPIIFTKCEATPINTSTTVTKPSPKIYYPNKSEPVNPGEPVYIPEINATCTYYEYETQEMYIIIYGKSKWLKEFYDVQLIVMNSDKKTLEDCSATLNVPEGLTLCNSEQIQSFGDLLPNEVKNAHWYLRGDVAGDYSISALFKGINGGEEFEYPFHAKDNIHVYAGDALKMTIACPGYSCYGYNYPIRITMKNVSDMPIYDLEHEVKAAHGYYKYKHVYDNGTWTCSETPVELNSTSRTIHVDELKPGESAVIDLTITDMWKSPLQKYLENSKLFIDALSLGLEDPLAKFIAGFASRFIDGITVVHVLDSICVTTLEDSTTSVPYQIVITNNLDEIGEDHTFSFTEAVVESAVDLLPNEAQAFLYGNQVFYKAFDFAGDFMTDAADDWEKVQNGEMTLEQYNKKYYVEYRDFIAGNASRIVAASGGGEYSGYATVGSDIYKIVTKPADCTYATAYVTDENGNIIRPNGTTIRTSNAALNRVFAAEEPDFEFEILTGDFKYDNGVYTFSEDCLIRMKANKPGERYIVHFVADEGYEAEFPFVTIPEHECKGGHYYVVSAPDSQNDGIAMQFCEECGKPVKTRHIPNSFCAMLSDGQMFQNVYQAAEFAKENYDEVELSLVGNITLDKDLVIPENVTLVITPFTNITYKNSAHIVVDGEYKDFSTDKDTEIYENIVLEYWDGRTEIMPVKYGKEVTELPVLCETCGFTGWYADAEFTEPFVPFTSGDKNHSKIYYADVHHSFKTSGKCSVCGELKNGKDAFQKVGISIGEDVKIKYVITLTEKALADKELRVQFEMSDGTTKTQYLSEAVDNGNGTYTFSCSVPFSELDENIKAQVCYSNNVKGSYLDYSAMKYADFIMANSQNFDEVTVDTIKALVNFSGYVQIFAGKTPQEAVNAGLGMPLDDVDVKISDDFNAVKTENSNAVTIKSASLSVEALSNINIRFALKNGAKVGDYKFTIDGKEVTPKKSGSTYIISMVGISPDNFDKMYKFKAESKSDASDYVSVEYSCLTYAKKIIETSSDKNVINAMKALYFYNQEIEKYIAKTKEA